jgi:hypothetical protein
MGKIKFINSEQHVFTILSINLVFEILGDYSLSGSTYSGYGKGSEDGSQPLKTS